MAKAKQEGGLYYTADGDPVDANGEPVEGAPKRAKNTDPSKQPGAPGAANSQADVMGQAIAKGLVEAQRAMREDDKGSSSRRDDADVELPTIAELPDAIAKLSEIEVRGMMKRDERVTAEPIYQKRLDEIKGE